MDDDSSPVLSVITSMNKGVRSFEDSKQDLTPRGNMSPLSLDLDRGPCLDELPKVFASFIEDDEMKTEKEPVGSLTPRLGESDPEFLAWIQTQGDTKKEATEKTNRSVTFSCEIRKNLNKYIVCYPIVRVRERASMDSKVVKKLACGSIVEAWEEVVVRAKKTSPTHSKASRDNVDDVIRRNPWVRLQDESGWVLTKSQIRPGTELMHQLHSPNYVNNAYAVLSDFLKKETTNNTTSGIRSGVRAALTQIQSSRVMQGVIAYQSRMIEHLQAELSIYQQQQNK